MRDQYMQLLEHLKKTDEHAANQLIKLYQMDSRIDSAAASVEEEDRIEEVSMSRENTLALVTLMEKKMITEGVLEPDETAEFFTRLKSSPKAISVISAGVRKVLPEGIAIEDLYQTLEEASIDEAADATLMKKVEDVVMGGLLEVGQDMIIDHLECLLGSHGVVVITVLQATKSIEPIKTKLLSLVTSTYGENIFHVVKELSLLTEASKRDGVEGSLNSERWGKLKGVLMNEMSSLSEECVQVELCNVLMASWGPSQAASLDTFRTMLNSTLGVSGEELTLTREISLAAGKALEEEEVDLRELLTRINRGDYSMEHAKAMEVACIGVIERLGWEYTEKGLYRAIESMVGQPVLSTMGCNQNQPMPPEVKASVLKVISEVFGEGASALTVVNRIQQGSVPLELSNELTSKLRGALLEAAHEASLKAVRSYMNEDPILRQFVGNDVDPELREQLLDVVFSVLGETDLDVALNNIRENKLSHRQRSKMYDAMADLVVSQQEEWVLNNQENIMAVEASLYVSFEYQILLRLFAVLALPFFVVIWLLVFPLVIVMLLLNLFTFFRYESVWYWFIVSSVLWQAAGALVMSDLVMFVSPMSGILVLGFHLIRVSLTKEVRGKIHEDLKPYTKKLMRATLKQIHYMHRRREAGLKLFRDGPLGDGHDLWEDIEEMDEANRLKRDLNKEECSDYDTDTDNDNILTWDEGSLLHSIFGNSLEEEEPLQGEPLDLEKRGATESSPLLARAGNAATGAPLATLRELADARRGVQA